MSNSMSPSAIAIAASFAMLVAGCGGGGGGSSGPSSMTGGMTPPTSSSDTDFAGLSPTDAGYAATAASRVADARPRSGSVTQSSNVNNGITVDRVSVTAQHGASRNSYSIRNGSSWSISTSDGNPVPIDAGDPWDGQELYKRTNGGTLYVDVLSDIEAPQRTTTAGTAQTVTASDRISHGGNVSFGEILNGDGRGSLDGVPGTFSCTGSCNWDIDGTYDPATNVSSGTVNSISGVTFTPDSGTTHTGPDTDYLAGGVWLFVPDNATSANDVVFGAFADGNDPFRQSNLVALQGTARYVGGAAGVYADRSSNWAGYWAGNVTLDADFGGRSDLGSIGGSVTGIEADDELVPGSMRLGRANIGSSNSGFFEGQLNGTVNGIGFTGRWGGQFFGNSEADGKPGSVGGTAAGRSADRSVSFVGAFGAFKSE